MVRIAAFLGNIGAEYARNRHNVAWLFLNNSGLAEGLSWQGKWKGSFASIEREGQKIWLLKPQTYMNLSGESLRELARFHQVTPEEILVIHDELELPFGVVSFKRGGGLGGHNGLRSVEQYLGTRDFLRFRFGIGRPEHSDIAGYVLSDFKREERQQLEEIVFPASLPPLEKCFTEGFETVEKDWKKVDVMKG